MSEEDQFKVVTTTQLREAATVARVHELRFALTPAIGALLDEMGHHTLGRLASDRGDRQHNGVPYLRVRALIALDGRLEPVERVIDVPAVCWAGWADGATVVAGLKAALSGLLLERETLVSEARP